MSERRRHGFPKTGHYDKWLIDSLQVLVEENHSVLVFPTWPHTADYADTTEMFGTVPMHSPELDAALKTIKLDPKVVKKFTSDKKYLCRCMGTPAPLLPVHGEEECKLFDSMARKTPGLDYDAMALSGAARSTALTSPPSFPLTSARTTRPGSAMSVLAGRWSGQPRANSEVELARINAETLQQLLPPPG